MANEKEKKPNEYEPKIPVFTVLKNGAILKNIFIVNKPPPPPHSIPILRPKPIPAVHQESQEEILIVGRHPDCNILLTHPSISRFHLQLLSNPSSQKLSLTDLSSVHGTWVSERKIEPGVRVELSDGDTLRVGSSSRVYRLHWIPLSRAYDFETPFVPPMTKHSEEENAEKVDQGVDSLPAENRVIESADLNSEGVETLFSDEISGLTGKKEIPSAPPMPDEDISSFCDQSEEGGESSSKEIGEQKEISSFWAFGTESVNLFFPVLGSHCDSEENQCLQPHPVSEEVSEIDNPEESSFSIVKDREAYPIVQVPEVTENQSSLRENHVQTDTTPLTGPPVNEDENLSLLTGETKNQLVKEGNLTPEPKSNFPVSLSFQHSDQKEREAYPAAQVPGETKNQLVEEAKLTPEGPEPKLNLLVSLNFQHSAQKEEEAHPAAHVPETNENQSPFRKDHAQTDMSCLLSEPLVMENLSLLIGEVLEESKNQQVEESLTPEPKSNVLVIQDFEHSEEFEKEDYPAAQAPEETGNQNPLRKDHRQTDNLRLLSGPLVMENLSLLIGEVVGETKNQQVEEGSMTPEPKSNSMVNLNFEHSDEIGCLVDETLRQTENKSVPLKDHETRDAIICSDSSEPLMTESINSSPPDGILSELIDDRESHTPQSFSNANGQPESEFCESPPLRSENKSSLAGSIWARRGKPASAVQIQTDRSRGKIIEAGIDDDAEQEEFTPDKENFTPNTLRLRSLKKKSKVEVKHSKSCRSSSLKRTLTNIQTEDLIVLLEKENHKFKDVQERKSVETDSGNRARLERKLMVTKRREERMPFQSLIEKSAGKKRSETSFPTVSTRSSSSFNCTQTMEKVTNPLPNKSVGEGKKRRWTVVADTTTLLDKESRKSLQLLQGLKGTQLIIPRMVIQELDSLKKRGSLFRKKTEACLVLEWIEECMVKTSWWIHVQSSAEDGRLIAPTPPVSPQSLFSEKSWGFPSATTSSLPFSRSRSWMDLVSPAAEDHILDCALLHRKMKHDGQLTLLSNDVTLKIKAMAEGLICETAQEFRESLVNPFSERFMWADSSPRGRTWSYLADVVLREKYNSYPLKKSSKGGEGAKGLKLILHHNSHYGQIR